MYREPRSCSERCSQKRRTACLFRSYRGNPCERRCHDPSGAKKRLPRQFAVGFGKSMRRRIRKGIRIGRKIHALRISPSSPGFSPLKTANRQKGRGDGGKRLCAPFRGSSRAGWQVLWKSRNSLVISAFASQILTPVSDSARAIRTFYLRSIAAPMAARPVSDTKGFFAV